MDREEMMSVQMNKQELEQYVDELYAIHSQLVEIHKESTERLFELSRDNRLTIEKAQAIKDDVVKAIEGMKVHNNWLGACVVVLMLIVGEIFAWQLHAFKRQLSWNMHYTYKELEKVVVVQKEQHEILKRLEGSEMLEKKEDIMNEEKI